MQSDDLNNINPQTLVMPPVPQALGELIAEVSSTEPDAIVIDRLSGSVLVYPKGSTSRTEEIDALSITSLLSNYEVHMLDKEVPSVAALLASEPSSTHVALFHYPDKVSEEECPQLKLIPTKVLSPRFLILCCKTVSEPSTYKLRGATLLAP